MSQSLEQLRETWRTLGAEDPLWAVVSHPDKRGGGRWDLAEFLATGERSVQRCHELLAQHAGAPARFRHILDFGCGVGRLTRAWSPRADRVTGVDISAPMLDRARDLAGDCPNVEFQLNERADLQRFGEGGFDLVCSLVCLQHMGWGLASGYLREFARVAAPGAWVVFQLPTRPAPGGTWKAELRQRLVEALPFGLDQAYRRWRHGGSTVFDVYFTPRERVEATVTAAGLSLVWAEPDDMAGPGTEGFLYLYRKPSAP